MPRTTDQNYGQTDVVVLTTMPTTVVSGPLLYKTSEPDRQSREPPLHVEGRFVRSADAAQHLRRV
jgi:hypothetical protein